MTDLPQPIVDYLAQRDAARADAVSAILSALTPWERHLFHDAAVMGYVQGLIRDRKEGCPKDSAVMALVVDACMADLDKWPAVKVLHEGEAEKCRDAASRVAELEAEREQLRALVGDLRSPSPCEHDVLGRCQTHFWYQTDPACPHARAKALFLVTEEQQ